MSFPVKCHFFWAQKSNQKKSLGGTRSGPSFSPFTPSLYPLVSPQTPEWPLFNVLSRKVIKLKTTQLQTVKLPAIKATEAGAVKRCHLLVEGTAKKKVHFKGFGEERGVGDVGKRVREMVIAPRIPKGFAQLLPPKVASSLGVAPTKIGDSQGGIGNGLMGRK